MVGAIYAAYEKQFGNEPPRTYMGASIIGKECDRALWYDFRMGSKEKFDGRKLRLFQTGHLAEPRFVKDLRDIGCEVHDVDPATNQQFGFVGIHGHMKGHMDAAGRHVPGGGAKWHCMEFKTHGSNSFKLLKKDGVQKSKRQHWEQMTWYMGKSGMDRALYLAVDKDTDELYAERIEFDPVEFAKIEARAERIIFATEPPAKMSNDPKYYQCGWCSHNGVCHGNQVPIVSCRTCVNATPERDGDGRWSCTLAPGGRASSIPVEVQRTGCPDHLPLPFLLTYADPTDCGEGWIQFTRNDNGTVFNVVTGKAQHHAYVGLSYTTHEVSAAKDHRAIGDVAVERMRSDFNGTVVG